MTEEVEGRHQQRQVEQQPPVPGQRLPDGPRTAGGLSRGLRSRERFASCQAGDSSTCRRMYKHQQSRRAAEEKHAAPAQQRETQTCRSARPADSPPDILAARCPKARRASARARIPSRGTTRSPTRRPSRSRTAPAAPGTIPRTGASPLSNSMIEKKATLNIRMGRRPKRSASKPKNNGPHRPHGQGDEKRPSHLRVTELERRAGRAAGPSRG